MDKWKASQTQTVADITTYIVSGSSQDQKLKNLVSQFDSLLWDMLTIVSKSKDIIQSLPEGKMPDALDRGSSFCNASAVDAVLIMEQLVGCYSEQMLLLEQIMSIVSPTETLDTMAQSPPNEIARSNFSLSWRFQTFVSNEEVSSLLSRLQTH